MAEDPFEALLGPYLLGELTVEEEHELERHLAECPECRRALDHARHAHDLLRRLAADEPPPELKDQTLAHVRSEAPARFRNWWIWGSAAAALLVVAILGVGLFRTITDDSSTGVPLAATALAPEAGGEVRVEEVGTNLQVKLEVWGMPQLKENQYYEMWYYAEDGDRSNVVADDDRNNAEDGGRISCGTFQVGSEGRATVFLTAPASSRHYPEIEITREPDDGDPSTSGAEVLEGELPSI